MIIFRSFKTMTPHPEHNAYVSRNYSQEAQDDRPRLAQRWPTACDAGPTLNQPWVNVSSLLGCLNKLVIPLRENEASTQCRFNVGPASSTLAQQWIDIGWMSRVCWEAWGWCNTGDVATLSLTDSMKPAVVPVQWINTVPNTRSMWIICKYITSLHR